MTPKQLERYVPKWLTAIEDREDAASEAWLRIQKNNGHSSSYAGHATQSASVDLVRKRRTQWKYQKAWGLCHGRESLARFGMAYGFVARLVPVGDMEADCEWLYHGFDDVPSIVQAEMAFNKMSDLEKEAILMLAEGRDIREIARRMKLHYGACKSMIYRAQKKARKLAGM